MLKNVKPTSLLSSGLIRALLKGIGALTAALVAARLFRRYWNPTPPAGPTDWDREPKVTRYAPVVPMKSPTPEELEAELADIIPGLRVTPAATQPAAPNVSKPATPESAETPASLRIVSYSATVARGSEVKLEAVAPPGSACAITYTNPSGKPSTAQGLGPKTCDEQGRASWTWMVSPGSSTGKAEAMVTCTPLGGVLTSATVTIEVS